jgi:AmmeMemoRadiSam system protein B
VILGVSHTETKRRFVLTKKDFETPLGRVATDRNLVEKVANRLGGQEGKGTKSDRMDFFADEFAHRSEHSIEFQVLFLQYLFGGREEIRIVPILCTAFHQHTAYSETQEEVESFLCALSQTIGEEEGICCIAGVDLSHIGRRFGQDVTLSPALVREAEAEDRAMLAYVLKGDSEGFLESIRREGDNRNVCGVPAIYSLLKLIKPKSSRLLRYGRAEEPNTHSLVTFAGAAFYSD